MTQMLEWSILAVVFMIGFFIGKWTIDYLFKEK